MSSKHMIDAWTQFEQLIINTTTISQWHHV